MRSKADAKQLCHVKHTFSGGLRFREYLSTSKGPKRLKIKPCFHLTYRSVYGLYFEYCSYALATTRSSKPMLFDVLTTQMMVCPHPLHQASPKDLEVLGDRGPSVRPTVQKMCGAKRRDCFFNQKLHRNSHTRDYKGITVYSQTYIYISLNQVQDGNHLTSHTPLVNQKSMNINPGPRPIR